MKTILLPKDVPCTPPPPWCVAQPQGAYETPLDCLANEKSMDPGKARWKAKGMGHNQGGVLPTKRLSFNILIFFTWTQGFFFECWAQTLHPCMKVTFFSFFPHSLLSGGALNVCFCRFFLFPCPCGCFSYSAQSYASHLSLQITIAQRRNAKIGLRAVIQELTKSVGLRLLISCPCSCIWQL